jgi:hypothetical protein
MMRPDGNTAPLAWQSDRGTWEWSYNDTELSGFYTLWGIPQQQLRFAINSDPAESDLARIDPQQLPSKIDVRATTENGPTDDALALVKHAAWSGRLLWLAIALMFLESFLAWQFGRGTA